MRAVVQRVAQASVAVDGAVVGEIQRGLCVLVGMVPEDTAQQAAWLADKLLGLRIFADAEKPMNRSVLDVGGSVLVISQFTLAADTTRGRRPSFTGAAAPEHAEQIYKAVLAELQGKVPTAAGRFGADMQVSIVNDGPVTFVLDSP